MCFKSKITANVQVILIFLLTYCTETRKKSKKHKGEPERDIIVLLHLMFNPDVKLYKIYRLHQRITGFI